MFVFKHVCTRMNFYTFNREPTGEKSSFRETRLESDTAINANINLEITKTHLTTKRKYARETVIVKTNFPTLKSQFKCWISYLSVFVDTLKVIHIQID